MNLNFPSRFLKKLEIYQQIRSGQGISKHKHLWKYEAAFLQYCYGRGHQHLSNFFRTKDVMKNIEKIEQDYPKNERHHILANLFWRGYVNAVCVEEVNEKDKRKVTNENLIDRSSKAFASDVIKDKEQFEKYFFQPTTEGLLIGEVLTEINNRNPLLKLWNNYKYNLVLDIIWLLGIFAIAKFILPGNLWKDVVEGYQLEVRGMPLDYTRILLLTVFVIWPLTAYLFRKLYLIMEGSNE